MDEVSYKCEAFARSKKIPRLRASFIHKVSRDISLNFLLPSLIRDVVEASVPSSQRMDAADSS